MPINQHSTVLVTGATGFVGRALIHMLSSLGCHIKLLARPGSNSEPLASNHSAELHAGDILSEPAVRQACKGVTHVFHLAACGQRGSHKEDETHEVNVEGTKILARAVAGEAQIERFVHLSSCAVHGNIEGGPATATAALAAEGSYAVSKLAAETWLNKFAAQSQLPVTVLRPCAIVGPGDHRLLKLFKLGKHRFVPLPGRGTNLYQMIHIDDFIRVMLAAAQAEQAVGKTYVCGNTETLSLREILEVIHRAGQTSSSKLRVIPLPLKTAKAVLSATERLCSIFGVIAPVPAARLAFFEHSHYFDTTRTLEDLGVKLQHDNVSTLLATHNWYVANKML